MIEQRFDLRHRVLRPKPGKPVRGRRAIVILPLGEDFEQRRDRKTAAAVGERLDGGTKVALNGQLGDQRAHGALVAECRHHARLERTGVLASLGHARDRRGIAVGDEGFQCLDPRSARIALTHQHLQAGGRNSTQDIGSLNFLCSEPSLVRIETRGEPAARDLHLDGKIQRRHTSRRLAERTFSGRSRFGNIPLRKRSPPLRKSRCFCAGGQRLGRLRRCRYGQGTNERDCGQPPKNTYGDGANCGLSP